jgi:hypothetical protein
MTRIVSTDSSTGRAAASAVAYFGRSRSKPIVTTTRTTIAAKINAGFGNVPYIRGEGPGLSWDKGLAMDCIADDRWLFIIHDASRPVVFKFLLNDVTWCVGEDYSVEPGTSFTLEPEF